jgi:polysaccharide pyruvyl transferase WcaK-like protein
MRAGYPAAQISGRSFSARIQMITVGLIFHSACSDNMGVGALTASQVEILRTIAGRLGIPIRIRILDWTQQRAPYITGPDIEIHEMTGRKLLNPMGYFRLVRGCDLVIDIGAGDSFADIYGARRLNRMFWMKYLVHMAGRPLVLAPQTYGPFRKPLSIRRARGTLRRSAVVASRDAKSTEAVATIAPGVPVIEASDVALRLPYDPPSPDRGAGLPQVGLNISGLLMQGGYTRNNMFGLSLDYPAMIRGLVERLLAEPEAPEVHLVSHVIPLARGAIEDDLQPALDLAAEYPQLRVAPAFATPSEAKSYIAGLDFFAGARMHACIAAFSSGVPVVPMAYSRKFEGLFGSLGYARTVDCTAESGEAIIDKVIAGFRARADLAAEIAPALAQGLERLARYETALEQVIARRAGIASR